MSTQIVGNTGLYFVCYELSKLGWNVMPTARNAKGIDLVAYNQTADRFVAVQVKALSKRNPVPLGNTLEKIMGDYWVIVNNLEGTPGVYVMTPEEVRVRAHRGEKEGRVSYWLQPKSYMLTDFSGRWDRIGDPSL